MPKPTERLLVVMIYQTEQTKNESPYSRRPAPKRPAVKTATKLPARPYMEGARPGASDFALAVEVVAVVVPFVWVWLEVTSVVRLESEPKAADTLLAFLHSEVE